MELHDLIGNIGLVLVALSFFFKNVTVLRTLNLTGAAMMVVYGAMIEEYQIWVLNAIIVTANGYFIFLDQAPQSEFNEIKESYRPGGLLDVFCTKHKDDIAKFFPEFELETLERAEMSIVLRDMTAVGIYAYRVKDKDAVILLDYVEPNYRDMANSIFLTTKKASEFRARGLDRMVCKSVHRNHRSYLKSMGFSQEDGSSEIFVKVL